MPLYAYRCTKCGAEEEHLQKFTDDPVTECGTCGGPLQKMITGTSFALKGGGWYADGYGSAGTGSGGGTSTAESSSGTGGSSSGGSDTSSSKPDKGSKKAASE